MPAEKLAHRLVTVLERYRDRWDPKELVAPARHFGSSRIRSTARKAGGRRRRSS